WQPRSTASLSTCFATSGYQSLTHSPLLPCWANLRFETSSGVLAVLPIAVTGRLNDAGRGLPPSFSRAGFGAKVSVCQGAAINEQPDDALRLRREVRHLRRERPSGRHGRAGPLCFHEGRQGDEAEAPASAGQEIAARRGKFEVRHLGLSRCNRTRWC